MRQLLVLVFAIPLSALACDAVTETTIQQVDLEAERTALMEKDRKLSELYTTGESPLDTFFASFADDGRVLAPSMPMVEGWEASRAVFAELEELPGYSLEYSPQMAEIGGAADLGYTIGTYHMTVPDSDGRLSEIEGKYMTIWRRQPDGKWKVAVDMFNADGPPVPVNK